MKGRKDAAADFWVPLVPEAMEIIAQARHTRDGFLFPSIRKAGFPKPRCSAGK